MKIVLKRTKKKPVPGFDFETGIIAYKYLYTDTGQVGHWNIALKFVVERGQPVPNELVLDLGLAKPPSLDQWGLKREVVRV